MKFVLNKTLLCLALVVATAVASPAGAADAKPAAPRTYIDTLDMSSPQASAQTFLKAFARSDYFAVFKLLSPEAQRDFTESIHTFDVQRLLPQMKGLHLTGSTYFDMRSKEDVNEIAEDPGLLFDDVMMAGQRLYILPFTVGANARLGAVEVKGDLAAVQVTSAGRPAELRLQLVRASSGHWKVDRVVWPGSSGEDRPWGAPAAPTAEAHELRSTPAGARIYPETLDMKTPEATAMGFLQAYARSDYFGVHQRLSPTARDGFMEGVFGYGDVKLIPRMKDNILPGSALLDRKDESLEMITDGALSFDDVLLAAERGKILPFTIGAKARLGKIDRQANAASIDIVTDGEPAALAMQLRLLPSGRWKVEQVSWDGSSPSAKPWGAAQQR